MDVLEAIRTRRSIGKVKPDPIAKETIETILEAGVWAPNHRLTEPWQFFVLSGEGRERLGHALARIALADHEDPDSPENLLKVEGARKKALRAPVIIAVAVTPSDRKEIIELEEYGAVNAAIQNMLLAIHALGLGAVWRSGEPCYHPLMNESFDLRPQDKMLGFIYLGIPDMAAPVVRRHPASEKTIWFE
ncbi:NAD(P)H nitroreductase [Paenibacillus baekrokdamisoli]|uniref:Putative NAD(P)H nitroreductase n=1 Tax=Paenibacillus baekrokdamisoli TaxID=1712516 RepID=A0A3G9IR72_9BACL|nr:nitroreductase [Paenibacillus baekrokdamisoli]MBB3070355.1 nitroreductase [Paenibacillus baekrokdamisoli]BBH21360.1 NAD(P)H nitroreductase [Paenibacillus baekrokdamisoli]